MQDSFGGEYIGINLTIKYHIYIRIVSLATINFSLDGMRLLIEGGFNFRPILNIVIRIDGSTEDSFMKGACHL